LDRLVLDLFRAVGALLHRILPIVAARGRWSSFRAVGRRTSLPFPLGRPGPGGSMTVSMGDRVAVLGSGSGTNLQALIDEPTLRRHLRLVLADRAGIRALERADAAGIPTAIVDPAAYPSRDDFDQAVLDVLQEALIDVVVSAGYLRVLGKRVLDVYEGRCL